MYTYWFVVHQPLDLDLEKKRGSTCPRGISQEGRVCVCDFIVDIHPESLNRPTDRPTMPPTLKLV